MFSKISPKPNDLMIATDDLMKQNFKGIRDAILSFSSNTMQEGLRERLLRGAEDYSDQDISCISLF